MVIFRHVYKGINFCYPAYASPSKKVLNKERILLFKKELTLFQNGGKISFDRVAVTENVLMFS